MNDASQNEQRIVGQGPLSLGKAALFLLRTSRYSWLTETRTMNTARIIEREEVSWLRKRYMPKGRPASMQAVMIV